MRSLMTAAVLAIAGMGCAGTTMDRVQRTTYFIESEYAPFAGRGTGSITGHLAPDLGSIRGRTVELRPVTSHSREWVEIHILGAKFMSAPDPRTRPYTRTTTTSDDGAFRFGDLPDGDYFVTAKTSDSQMFVSLGRAQVARGKATVGVTVARCRSLTIGAPSERCRSFLSD